MTTLNRESSISTDVYNQTIFVRTDTVVGIAPAQDTHRNLALTDGLVHPDSSHFGKLLVDDGGQMRDEGEVVVLDSYITSSTLVRSMAGLEDGDIRIAFRTARLMTGQLVANTLQKRVLVIFEDGSMVDLEPEPGLE